MAVIKPMEPEDYPALHKIAVRDEPFAQKLTLEHMKLVLAKREGWSVWDGEKLIGAITMSNLVPLVDVLLHVLIDRDYHGKWCTLAILKEVHAHCFETMELRRVSAYSYPGISDGAWRLLFGMGYKPEGVREQAILADGQYYDVMVFGMLRERCPWIMSKKDMLEWLKQREK